MEKSNVESWYSGGRSPVTRISSCNPGLRRRDRRRPRWRCDARRQRRVQGCSSKHRHRGTDPHWCFLLRQPLAVPRRGIRDVYGRRRFMASLLIKAKKERLKPLFFYARPFPCSTIGRSGLRAPGFTYLGQLSFGRLMPGTSSGKTRFARLPGHDERERRRPLPTPSRPVFPKPSPACPWRRRRGPDRRQRGRRGVLR